MTTTNMTGPKLSKETLQRRIANASQKMYFARVLKKDGHINIIATTKIDCLKTSCEKNPNVIWLHSSRLMGETEHLRELLSAENVEKFRIEPNIATIIDYDIRHPLNGKNITSDTERDSWGFTSDFELVKDPNRKSYRQLYESEFAKCKKEREELKQTRLENIPEISLLHEMCEAIRANPSCIDVMVGSSGTTTLSKYRLSKEQTSAHKRKMDLKDRILSCQKEDTYLNVTKMAEDGSAGRVVVSKPKGAVSFDSDQLKNVFFTRPKGDEEHKGAINFIERYHNDIGKPFKHQGDAKSEIRRVISKCAAIESGGAAKYSSKAPIVVFEKNNVPIAPNSPRQKINARGAGDDL